jgi:hypothetical protein
VCSEQNVVYYLGFGAAGTKDPGLVPNVDMVFDCMVQRYPGLIPDV